MKKLIRMLKFAHAAEIAAYHAYEGHWRSVSNQDEQKYIRKIQLDELKHIRTLKTVLVSIDSEPNGFLDHCGKIVGEIVGLACYHTGWRLPMLIAGLMEKIGTASYKNIALEAADNDMKILTVVLLEMAHVEDNHEKYFQQLRNKR